MERVLLVMGIMFVFVASLLGISSSTYANQRQYNRCVANCTRHTRGAGINNCTQRFCTKYFQSGK
jgi:hypothetical protein